MKILTLVDKLLEAAYTDGNLDVYVDGIAADWVRVTTYRDRNGDLNKWVEVASDG